MSKKLTWSTVQRKVKDLIPADWNPRGITNKELDDLKASFDKFDLVEIPVINTDNLVIAGHQRLAILMFLHRGEEMIDVRYPSRTLTDDEVREYNIRSNKNTGHFDRELLEKNFKVPELLTWGFTKEELGLPTEFEKEFGDSNDSNVRYPIIPKFSEKYSCIIIIADNETDIAFIENALEVRKEKSYKNKNVGKGTVITAKRFAEIWKSR